MDTLNATLMNYTQQSAVAASICALVSGLDSYYYGPCQDALALRERLQDAHENQTHVCANSSLPCDAPELGTCNLSTDACACFVPPPISPPSSPPRPPPPSVPLPRPPPPPSPSPPTLPRGIVGIVGIAVGIGGLLLLGFVWWCVCRRNRGLRRVVDYEN